MKKLSREQYLSLLKEITFTQFKLKDQSTFFGFIWSFLHPLILLIVLVFFFRFRMGQEVDHYPVFVLIGVIQYTHFSNCTSSSMTILRSMKSLTCNAVFPKEVLVMGAVLANSVEFILSMLICISIAAFQGVNISWAVSLLPVVFLLQLMMVLWISFILSCLYVFVKDIGHIYQVFLRVLFFSTPIFYNISFLKSDVARKMISLNPLAHLMGFSRTLIIDGNLFPLRPVFLFFLLNMALLYAGMITFRRFEPRLAEHV